MEDVEGEELPVEEELPLKTINIEVKGAVKKTGVYTLDEGSIVNDVIKKAGGFLNSSYTSNINLSKHLSDEMVIYVYTKDEYKKTKEKEKEIAIDEKIIEKTCVCEPVYIDTCIEEKQSIIITKEDDSHKDSKENINAINENKDKNEESGDTVENKEPVKININTAGIDELTSLNGIGDAKARNIISYRNENGLFLSIEDIMKVSGISENIYAKIKDDISI